MQDEERVIDNFPELLAIFPPFLQAQIEKEGEFEQLVELILDLGRYPEARYQHRYTYLSDRPVTREDLKYVIERVGEFGKDNRAGIERTLHRISGIRNRHGDVVGLTCRLGRAVYGTIDIIRDVIEAGKSILLLGRPGVGKTTMLREIARVLSEEFNKRVVIVDTSNEIAGDGDIPHPAIGRARRMQVPFSVDQHHVMIEAVENHMPEVIIIDEIGTEQEAKAARTIAERGVQLIGTAHGNTLHNLIMNPTLVDLVGGIQAVTLGDEEARRRGSQKTILERKAPPTFEVVVEIQEKDVLGVHFDVDKVVDEILLGHRRAPQMRRRGENGKIEIREPQEEEAKTRRFAHRQEDSALDAERVKRVFPYGISRDYLERVIKRLHLPVLITKQLHEADALLVPKREYKKKPAPIVVAEERQIPVYLVKSNTVQQISFALREILGEEEAWVEDEEITRETEEAIRMAMEKMEPVELSPRRAKERHTQHRLAEKAGLASYSIGEEPNRRVVIYCK